MTRTYQSPLRAEQMEQTREKILEAVLELTNERADDVTVASAAQRAGVSVRTAYRYFPTLDDLLDAFNVWLGKKLGTLKLPSERSALPQFIQTMFEYFERNEAFFRASRARSLGNTVDAALRSRRKVDQVKAIEKIVAPLVKNGDPGATRKMGGQLHALMSLDNYLQLTEVWRLTRQEAADATAEAVERLLASWEEEGR